MVLINPNNHSVASPCIVNNLHIENTRAAWENFFRHESANLQIENLFFVFQTRVKLKYIFGFHFFLSFLRFWIFTIHNRVFENPTRGRNLVFLQFVIFVCVCAVEVHVEQQEISICQKFQKFLSLTFFIVFFKDLFLSALNFIKSTIYKIS